MKRVWSLIRQLSQIVFGPWPLSPIVSGLVLSAGALTQFIALAILAEPVPCRIWCVDAPGWLAPAAEAYFSADSVRQLDVAALFLNSTATGLVGALALYLLGKSSLLTAGKSARLRYLLSLEIGSLASSAARTLVVPVVAEATSIKPMITYSVRMFVVLLITQSILGMSGREYRRALARAETALAELHRQQILVVEADERARREVAAFLHDRVQARLLVLGMRIRALTTSSPDVSQELSNVVNELESIRSEDIRGAGRRLSPDLHSLGLDSALSELASAWTPGMIVALEFDPRAHRALHRADASPELLLVIYRTIEQALLNAAGHGRASHVDVSISIDDEHVINITVTDDGAGVGPVSPGSGSAHIDAWMAMVEGGWSLESAPFGGAILRAHIPARPN